MQISGRVGGDILQVDPDAGTAVIRSIGILFLPHPFDHSGQRCALHRKIDKSRSGDLIRSDTCRLQIKMRHHILCDLPWVAVQLPCQLHGAVACVIAMALILGDLDDHLLFTVIQIKCLFDRPAHRTFQCAFNLIHFLPPLISIRNSNVSLPSAPSMMA